MGEQPDLRSLRTEFEAARKSGKRAEQYEIGRRLLQHGALDTVERIGLMISTAVAAEQTGDQAGALSLAEGALELALVHGDKHGQVDALSELGVQFRKRGELERSESLLREGLEIAQQLGDKALRARCTANLATTLFHAGRPDRAHDSLEVANRLYRDLGDLAGVNRMLHLRARVQESQGLLEGARDTLEEVIELDLMTGDDVGRAYSLGNVALLLLDMGDPGGAAERLLETIAIFEKHGLPEDVARARDSLGVAWLRQGDPAAALKIFDQALDESRRLKLETRELYALQNRGAALYRLDRAAEARACAEEVLLRASPDGLLDLRRDALVALARVEMQEGNHARALELLDDALALAETQNMAGAQATALRLKAEVLRRQGQLDDAREHALRGIEALDESDAMRTVEYLMCATLAAQIEAQAGDAEQAGFLVEEAAELGEDLELTPDHPDPEVRHALRVMHELLP